MTALQTKRDGSLEWRTLHHDVSLRDPDAYVAKLRARYPGAEWRVVPECRGCRACLLPLPEIPELSETFRRY